MTKITVKLWVGKRICSSCRFSSKAMYGSKYCYAFFEALDLTPAGKPKRCKECLEAEVKDA